MGGYRAEDGVGWLKVLGVGIFLRSCGRPLLIAGVDSVTVDGLLLLSKSEC